MSRTIALFADVNNLFYCCSKKFSGRKLDYKKYLASVVGSNTLYRAFAYGTQLNDEAIPFMVSLKHSGFEIKYRKPRVIETTGEMKKVVWTVGLAMDAVRLIERVDTIVIGSSDPALEHLVDWIKGAGVRCLVHACGISPELRDKADEWVEISENLLEGT